MNGAPILQADGLCKSFPGVRALEDVSVQLHPGRLVALVGENGAGKSTLMSILTGAATPDRGELRVDGRVVSFAGTRDAVREGIVAIFQELSLAMNLTVAENIFLGREPRTRLGLIDYPWMHAEAQVLLERMGLTVSPEASLGSLRVGQQQAVEIARALSVNARVLILDEPTSALAQQETAMLLKLVNELKRAGVALAYITHRFEELAPIADEIAVMRDGKLVAHRAFGELSHEEIVRLMVGREMRGFKRQPLPGADGPGVAHENPAAQDLLRVEPVSLPHPRKPNEFFVHAVDLSVKHGEVLGLFGLMGAGRTELLESLFGVHGDEVSCRMTIAGERFEIRSPAEAIAAGVVLVPEDRKHDGLVPEMSSRENAALACTRAASRWGLLHRGREAALVGPLLDRMRLKVGSVDAPVRNLSGGNQQKVILAKWLATRPKVLLLDEPTRGIDVNARNEIYQLIQDFAAEGLGVVLASSELPELLAMCDRILVLCEGRKVAEFPRAQATPERLLQAALPRPPARSA
jgi:ribose transport system ATP-binding protein